MPYLALILFLPWFLLMGALFWLFPRQPRDAARKRFDIVALAVAFVLSFGGMQWGYALGLADVGTGAIWKQVLATLVAYGAFLAVMFIAVVLRSWWLQRRNKTVGAPHGRELLRSDREYTQELAPMGRSYESRIVDGCRAR